MLTVALEHERLIVAERLLREIERRHGLPPSQHTDLQPAVVDRFLAAYLPESREGEPAPSALEYAFTPTLGEAVDLLARVIEESPAGYGSAIYVHDLDVGNTTE
ncbi:MAG: hypothetical protein ABI637_04495 [Gemmatimonadota bacterium]